jgi:hypothetical protein
MLVCSWTEFGIPESCLGSFSFGTANIAITRNGCTALNDENVSFAQS